VRDVEGEEVPDDGYGSYGWPGSERREVGGVAAEEDGGVGVGADSGEFFFGSKSKQCTDRVV